MNDWANRYFALKSQRSTNADSFFSLKFTKSYISERNAVFVKKKHYSTPISRKYHRDECTDLKNDWAKLFRHYFDILVKHFFSSNTTNIFEPPPKQSHGSKHWNNFFEPRDFRYLIQAFRNIENQNEIRNISFFFGNFLWFLNFWHFPRDIIEQ